MPGSRAGFRKLRVSDPSSAYELLVFDKHWRLVEPLNEWYRLRKHRGSPRTGQTYLAMLSPFLGYLLEHDYPWNAEPDAIREYTRQYLMIQVALFDPRGRPMAITSRLRTRRH